MYNNGRDYSVVNFNQMINGEQTTYSSPVDFLPRIGDVVCIWEHKSEEGKPVVDNLKLQGKVIGIYHSFDFDEKSRSRTQRINVTLEPIGQFYG